MTTSEREAPPADLAERVDAVFDPGGPLALRLPGFELREAPRRCATAARP